jgi:hypothetical protein
MKLRTPLSIVACGLRQDLSTSSSDSSISSRTAGRGRRWSTTAFGTTVESSAGRQVELALFIATLDVQTCRCRISEWGRLS